MSPLEVLQHHYTDKTIQAGGHDYLPLSWRGKKIVHVAMHPFEPIFEFTLSDGDSMGTVDVLKDWDVPVA